MYVATEEELRLKAVNSSISQTSKKWLEIFSTLSFKVIKLLILFKAVWLLMYINI